MSTSGTHRTRILSSLALACLVGLLGLLLRAPRGPFGGGLVRGSYDSLHAWTGQADDTLAASPVVIVYLDLNSFISAHQDPTHPWPRALHANLLRRLMAAGARAVAFDIVFSAAGPDPAGDQAFAEAIRESGRVILAGEASGSSSHVTSEDRPWARMLRVSSPFELFATNAAAWGMATHIIDEDFVVRRYLAGFTSQPQASLTWAAAQWLQLPLTRRSEALSRANQYWIRYYGPALAIPHVSYVQALEAGGVPEDFFRGKIVLVGARPMTELFHERQDEFRSPFHSWRHKELFMPGVEVHATELLNLIRGDSLRASGRAWEITLLLCAAAFGGGLLWLRPVQGAVVALAGGGATFGMALVAFTHNLWFPWLIISAAQIPTALGISILFYSVDWYRARRRLEAAKRAADTKIREQAALIDKAHDAILVQDLQRRVLYLNPSAERLYGWKLAELQDKGAWEELVSPEPQAAEAAMTAAINQGEWSGELRQQTKEGNIVTVSSRWTLIRDESGQPKAVLLINSDVTEKKELEAQFFRTQRMNTIGNLAGGIAHDLNNALAPILMGVQLLRRKSKDDEARDLLQLMESSTHRGIDMVRQVLLFARGRGGDFQRLELGPLFKDLEKMLRETFPKTISVNLFLARDLWPVRGNSTQLYQVLLNLCVNARDAMPGGGNLSFVADNVELDANQAASTPEARVGQFVSILVTDTGTGMPAEVRAKIFEPFFTTKAEGRGTGLGLSTVLRLVKAHEGFLRIESEPGQGTTFEIFLPRAVEAAPMVEIPRAEPLRGHGETILLADDEQAIRELLTTELTAAGYRILAAANGAEAVAIFREHTAEISLFITDGAMPVLDGAGAIAAVRSVKRDLPVIVTSGESGDATAMKVALMPKPFSIEDILACIQQQMVKEKQ